MSLLSRSRQPPSELVTYVGSTLSAFKACLSPTWLTDVWGMGGGRAHPQRLGRGLCISRPLVPARHPLRKPAASGCVYPRCPRGTARGRLPPLSAARGALFLTSGPLSSSCPFPFEGPWSFPWWFSSWKYETPNVLHLPSPRTSLLCLLK